MSRVTDIILTCSGLEEVWPSGGMPAIERLNSWLDERYGCHVSRVDQRAGGTKVMQANVFLCAINYLDEDEFIDEVAKVGWQDPGAVRVMLKGEEDDGFRVVLDDLWFRLREDRA